MGRSQITEPREDRAAPLGALRFSANTSEKKMAAAQRSPRFTRLNGVLGFFVGIFGAMAILGVFFKILKLPHYEIFMIIGFVGEAAAFVIMGLFSLIGSFTKQPYEDLAEQPAAPAPPPGVDAAEAVRASFHKMLEKKVSDDVNKMMQTLAKEIGTLGSEISQVGGELERARSSIHTMRQELDRVASGDLAGDAERLGRGMQVLGTEMSQAGDTVERMRTDLEDMAQRFRHFNEPYVPQSAAPESKIKKMPWS